MKMTINGANLYLSPRTAKVVMDEMADKQDEQDEKAARAWLADPANRCDPFYSVIYKDVYGIRPRF